MKLLKPWIYFWIMSYMLFYTLEVRAASLDQSLSQLNGLKIRLIPSNPEAVSDLGIKTIEIEKKDDVLQVKWFSTVRRVIAEEPWPEYKISIDQGILQTKGLEGKTHMILPHLWSKGFFEVETSSLIWMPPEIIENHKANKSFIFSPGLLSPSFLSFKKGPIDLVERIDEFRKVVEFIQMPEEEKKVEQRLNPNDKKKLLNFIEEFHKVRTLSLREKQLLVINGEQTKVATMIVGNKFIKYTVLMNIRNPLILSVAFYPNEVPAPFDTYFSFFKEYLEYQITQVKVD